MSYSRRLPFGETTTSSRTFRLPRKLPAAKAESALYRVSIGEASIGSVAPEDADVTCGAGVGVGHQDQRSRRRRRGSGGVSGQNDGRPRVDRSSRRGPATSQDANQARRDPGGRHQRRGTEVQADGHLVLPLSLPRPVPRPVSKSLSEGHRPAHAAIPSDLTSDSLSCFAGCGLSRRREFHLERTEQRLDPLSPVDRSMLSRPHYVKSLCVNPNRDALIHDSPRGRASPHGVRRTHA